MAPAPVFAPGPARLASNSGFCSLMVTAHLARSGTPFRAKKSNSSFRADITPTTVSVPYVNLTGMIYTGTVVVAFVLAGSVPTIV